MAWSLRVIEASGGAVEVRHIADELGYSQKHLITLFRDQVGLPPKLLAQLVRFHRLMRHISSSGRGGQEPWAELSAAFGYADQPHLARQVKRFTGLTPEALRREVGGTPAFAADGAG